MKVKIIFCLVVLIFSSFYLTPIVIAEDITDTNSKQSLQIVNFDIIKISSGVKVNIYVGAKYNIIINSHNNLNSNIKVYKNENSLIVKKNNYNHVNGDVNVYLPVLKELSLANGAKVFLSGDFNKLSVYLNDGSHISGNGTVNNLRLKLKSGSFADFKNFKAKNVYVSTTGGANCEVYAIEKLNASAWFGGNVTYYGYPVEVNKSTWFGGHVILK